MEIIQEVISPPKEESTEKVRMKMSLEDFQIQAILGKGYDDDYCCDCSGYGKVYHVFNTKSKKYYAMKVLKKAEIVRRRQVSRTKIERAILEQANFPFIARLHYAFQTDYRLYMVIDFMQGGDLFTHLSRFGVFSEERTRFYMAEIILALDHLHKMGIIYVHVMCQCHD